MAGPESESGPIPLGAEAKLVEIRDSSFHKCVCVRYDKGGLADNVAWELAPLHRLAIRGTPLTKWLRQRHHKGEGMASVQRLAQLLCPGLPLYLWASRRTATAKERAKNPFDLNQKPEVCVAAAEEAPQACMANTAFVLVYLLRQESFANIVMVK